MEGGKGTVASAMAPHFCTTGIPLPFLSAKLRPGLGRADRPVLR